ncbi:MAG: TonB-dependent receptor [Cryomorphaceae bacterium]|jgi:hypothetical protein|nr:TonB-dependent receptor [Cryomorphaceae bacterium]
MKKLLLALFVLLLKLTFAQSTQIVRGKIFDSETNFPLYGAKAEVFTGDSLKRYRAISDEEGRFEINDVPVGKHQLEIKLATYDTKSITIEVTSGKECVVNAPMTERIIEKQEIKVTARKKGEVINEMALISAQQFSVEETNRYPGSRMDPARMASNFAGVQGADDSRNDIVIRGNSPLGVVYKVEGIDIPNPSHFAIAGSTGGPVSVLNNKMLGNSDFFMSAFPAEFGNSTSGIFDLKLRNGNDKTHEFTGQFGLFGTEFLAEGPLNKKNMSSYMVMGRYSTLSIFQTLGIKIGTDAIPVYGDAAFKLNWRLKKGGFLSLFGIGGKSEIAIKISEQTEYSSEFYGEGDRDQYFGTSMGVAGLTYKKSLNEKTFLASTFAASFEEQHARHEYLLRSLNVQNGDTSLQVNDIYPLMGYKFGIAKYSNYTSINHKISKKHLLKFGVYADVLQVHFLDSVLSNITLPGSFVKRWDYAGTAGMVQPFIQWKWRISENMDLTAGIHSHIFHALTLALSPAEPRLGWKYRFGNGQAIFAGAGMHSQTQPLYTYYYHQYNSNDKEVRYNAKMDFMRSVHSGIGYEKAFNKGFNIRTEAYYQYLYNVPVTIVPSSFSMINMGSGFARIFADSLQNTGLGINYGIELTIQKYFDKSFFFLFSGTLYDSKYAGSDNIWRNTSYNGAYVVNFLAGKEFKLNEKHIIGIGTKVTAAGGKRYGLVDVVQTDSLKEIIFRDSLFNELQFKDYFRMDLKISWRMNANKVTHEFGLDLVNILNTRNLLSLAYAPSLDPAVVNSPNYQPISEKTQLGFLPIFYYKIDFKLSGK